MAADIDLIRAARDAEKHRAQPKATPNPYLPAGYAPLMIGPCTVPFELETRHILMLGTTGAGKTQAMKQVLGCTRQREIPALIIDHGGEMIQFLYREGIDIILNPMDERSVGWCVFNETKRRSDFPRAAKLIIPDIDGPNQEWIQGAQQLLANLLYKLWKFSPDARCNKALLYFTLEAPLRGKEAATALEWMLQGTASARMFEEGNEKALAITMGIVAKHMEPLTYLREGDFSITDHVKSFEKIGVCRRTLFFSYTDQNYDAISSLMTMFMEFAVHAGLSLSESAERRFNIVLDELGSLKAMKALQHALTKLRKYGGVVIAGLQSTSQLQEQYGEKGAQSLLSCFGTILMLRVADDETAEKLSKIVGDRRVVKTSTSDTLENSDGKYNKSETSKEEVERGLLGSAFTTLPDRTGYLRIAGMQNIPLIGMKKNGDPDPASMIPVATWPVVAPKEIPRQDLDLDWLDEQQALLEPEIETLEA